MKTLRSFSRSAFFLSARVTAVVVLICAAAAMAYIALSMPASAQATARPQPFTPRFSTAVAFDVSPALRDMPLARRAAYPGLEELREIRPERGPAVRSKGYSGDNALQTFKQATSANGAATISGTLANFEGLSDQDNINIFGFPTNPPDPVGDVGPNHYVEMVNLIFAVYDKQGNRLLGPIDIDTLWAGFAIPDCTDPTGDPVVLYDQLEDRWLLSQFTSRRIPFYNCVAISQTGDPTGAYYRYAFITSNPGTTSGFFPDYPKYGVWSNSYLLTTRDSGTQGEYGISVYALEKNKMINGQPNARAVHFFLDSAVVPIYLIGDGLLPADIDGTRRPISGAPAPIVGTQDDDGPYGAAFDALNIWELNVKWQANPVASIAFKQQLPVASFDSIFPCAPNNNDCLPQPGITNPDQYLDILSYQQRPTFRLSYRNFGTYESLVTNQSVEALPGVAGARWYEIRRAGGNYSVYQQGTYAPNDGVHRWMGSIAQDKNGNMALGYSVVNGTNVYPGIRYTGRLHGDTLGQMTLGEATIINGSGVQLTTDSRWGDYTDMTVDPTDDCTFWYVNEYYTAAGQASGPAGWQTRVASFRLPGCH